MRARAARGVTLSRPLAGVLALALGVGAASISSVIVPASPARADSIRDAQYWLDSLGIREAWQTTRGEGVTIAIIDSGIDAGHADLRGAVIDGTDVSGAGTSAGSPVAGSAHGTMVASLAAGRGSSSSAGVIGAAPEASILSVSLSFGAGKRPGDAQVADGVRWAVDHGADIISLSLTRNQLDWPTSWDEAFLYAEQNDVVVVAAAGNRGSGTDQVGAPATIPGVLAVGGIDRAGRASDIASTEGITIGVMAPSEGLVGAVPGGGHRYWQGTSGATPIVAGIAALVRAAHPELSAAAVVDRLVRSADPVTNTVPDPDYGYGVVDAAAAVEASIPVASSNPLGSLEEWISVHRRADAEARVVELLPARPGIGRVPANTDVDALPVPPWALVELGRVLPGLLVIGGVLLALAALALAGVLRFVASRHTQ